VGSTAMEQVFSTGCCKYGIFYDILPYPVPDNGGAQGYSVGDQVTGRNQRAVDIWLVNYKNISE